jgi:hypothetical protein
VLLALPRDKFLDTLTGHGEAHRLAEDVVTHRLRTT